MEHYYYSAPLHDSIPKSSPNCYNLGLGQYSIFIIMFMKIWFIAKFFSIWWLYISLGITFCFPWSYYISPCLSITISSPVFHQKLNLCPHCTVFSLPSGDTGGSQGLLHGWASDSLNLGVLPIILLCFYSLSGTSVKNLPANAGDAGSISGSGRSPG